MTFSWAHVNGLHSSGAVIAGACIHCSKNVIEFRKLGTEKIQGNKSQLHCSLHKWRT